MGRYNLMLPAVIAAFLAAALALAGGCNPKEPAAEVKRDIFGAPVSADPATGAVQVEPTLPAPPPPLHKPGDFDPNLPFEPPQIMAGGG